MKKITVLAGVVLGIGVITWMSLSSLADDPSRYGNIFHSYLTIVFGTLSIFMAGFLISYLAGRSKD